MRLLLLCLMLLPALACAQTRDVNPGELALEVTLETSAEEIFQGEMVLVTIHGRYRRHITLEKLETPELDGFNWMQLGQDTWYETRERGASKTTSTAYRNRRARQPKRRRDGLHVRTPQMCDPWSASAAERHRIVCASVWLWERFRGGCGDRVLYSSHWRATCVRT